jgi:hypothetical protein
LDLKILKPIAKTITCHVKNDGDLLMRNWNGLLLPLIALPYDLSLTPVISEIKWALKFASSLELILFSMAVNKIEVNMIQSASSLLSISSAILSEDNP